MDTVFSRNDAKGQCHSDPETKCDTFCHKMYPHTTFWISISNNIGNMLPPNFLELRQDAKVKVTVTSQNPTCVHRPNIVILPHII